VSEDTPSKLPLPADSPQVTKQRKSILIVEDDDVIRETLEFYLDLEGYQVFTAANGKQGLDLLPTIPRPCLILLDLMMPVLDGWGFVEELQKDLVRATIPVVVVTAFVNKAKTIRAKEVIFKPVDLNQLSEVVKQYCGEC